MARWAFRLAYDGTDFAGWQRQASLRTVQGALEDALARLTGCPVVVHGASRTDAGVHALAQVAHADLPSLDRLEGRGGPAQQLRRRLNAVLPDDVRVERAVAVAEGFHARKSALSKRYRYQLDNAPVASPFARRYRWHVPQALDLDAMSLAARRFEGRRDFASLRAAGSSATTSVREITRCAVLGPPPQVVVEVEGSGFLRHMVRALVGSLLDVGRGRRQPEWVSRMLDAKERGEAGPNVPAHGLFLAAVEYAEPDELVAPAPCDWAALARGFEGSRR